MKRFKPGTRYIYIPVQHKKGIRLDRRIFFRKKPFPLTKRIFFKYVWNGYYKQLWRLAVTPQAQYIMYTSMVIYICSKHGRCRTQSPDEFPSCFSRQRGDSQPGIFIPSYAIQYQVLLHTGIIICISRCKRTNVE